MAINVVERVERDIVPIVEGLGYEVVEVSYKRVGRTNELTIFIHKKGGVDLNDCERVNNALEQPLEQFDVTNGSGYTLNISSPGLDRPIVTNKDLERNLEQIIQAFFIQNVDKKKKIKGKLVAYDDQDIHLDANGKLVKLQRNNIRLMQRYIDFK